MWHAVNDAITFTSSTDIFGNAWFEPSNRLNLTERVIASPTSGRSYATVVAEELTHGAWDMFGGTERLNSAKQELVDRYRKQDFGDGKPAVDPERAANEAMAEYAGRRITLLFSLLSSLERFANEKSVGDDAVATALQNYRDDAKRSRTTGVGYEPSKGGGKRYAKVPLPESGQDFVDTDLLGGGIPDEPTEQPIVRQWLSVINTHPSPDDGNTPSGGAATPSSSSTGQAD
jgi:hypothetical protein